MAKVASQSTEANRDFATKPERLSRRALSERLFRAITFSCVGFAIAILAIILISILSVSVRAFTHHQLSVPLEPALDRLLGSGASGVDDLANSLPGFNALVIDGVEAALEPQANRTNHRSAFEGFFAPLAVSDIAQTISDNPSLLGVRRQYSVPLSSGLDQYLKGQITDETLISISAETLSTMLDGRTTLALNSLPDIVIGALEGAATERPSVFLETGEGVYKVEPVDAGNAQLSLLIDSPEFLNARGRFRVVWRPESQRAVSDLDIALARVLKQKGVIKSRLNTRLFRAADSTYPELAGTLAALVGSLLTLLVTASVSVPIGVMAAIWLEEFAPRNRFTDFVEVNINNLAAVPSIVFGLLGAAVLLNLFGLPRSAPLVGGLVLALMTLPTVIIASRAALSAVPQDLRTAALSLGASPMQVVADHVLPAAAPGILTGVILGLARSLGETAPLLLIGMVVFIGEVPTSLGDDATTLPVLIYKWSTGAERAWEPLTAAAIVILLFVMVCINVLVSYLRQRFERKW
ncbi:MAG: phosphate ABC transporter permease PstA [Pseudomonadota bacterium]